MGGGDGGSECMAARKGDGCDDGCKAMMDECPCVANVLQVNRGTGMM